MGALNNALSLISGLVLFLFGMHIMGEALEKRAGNQLKGILSKLTASKFKGLLFGMGVTAIIQSSSASVGILQALSATGKLTVGSAIPIIMGQNIGTCITAIISSVGATKNAKRAAAVHLYFNIIGTAVILSVFCLTNAIFKYGFTASEANEFNIALIHTAFNLLCTLILYPFSEKLEKLAVATVRDGKKKESVQELDERLLATPSIAIDRCRVAVDSMAATSVDALNKAFGLFDKFDEKIVGEIDKDEDSVDKYEDIIGSYLVELSARSMTAEDSKEVTKYLHTIGDLERLSDHAVNLARSLDEMNDKKLSFSAQAKSDLTVMFNAVKEILGMTYDCLIHNDVRKAALVEPLEQVIDTLKADIKKGHIKRLQNEECTIEMGFILSDVITNLERISDHCSNIAGCIIELSSNNSLSVHEYLHEVKDGTGSTSSAFRENYEIYLKKYHLA